MHDHYFSFIKRTKWLPAEKFIYLRSATVAFKLMTGSATDYLTSKFTKRFNNSGREIRNSQSLHIPLFKSASGQRSFNLLENSEDMGLIGQ